MATQYTNHSTFLEDKSTSAHEMRGDCERKSKCCGFLDSVDVIQHIINPKGPDQSYEMPKEKLQKEYFTKKWLRSVIAG